MKRRKFLKGAAVAIAALAVGKIPMLGKQKLFSGLTSTGEDKQPLFEVFTLRHDGYFSHVEYVWKKFDDMKIGDGYRENGRLKVFLKGSTLSSEDGISDEYLLSDDVAVTGFHNYQ